MSKLSSRGAIFISFTVLFTGEKSTVIESYNSVGSLRQEDVMDYKLFYHLYNKFDSHQLLAAAEEAAASSAAADGNDSVWYRHYYDSCWEGFLVSNGEAEVEADRRFAAAAAV